MLWLQPSSQFSALGLSTCSDEDVDSAADCFLTLRTQLDPSLQQLLPDQELKTKRVLGTERKKLVEVRLHLCCMRLWEGMAGRFPFLTTSRVPGTVLRALWIQGPATLSPIYNSDRPHPSQMGTSLFFLIATLQHATPCREMNPACFRDHDSQHLS